MMCGSRCDLSWRMFHVHLSFFSALEHQSYSTSLGRVSMILFLNLFIIKDSQLTIVTNTNNYLILKIILKSRSDAQAQEIEVEVIYHKVHWICT